MTGGWIRQAAQVQIEQLVASYTGHSRRRRFGPCPACKADTTSREDRRPPCIVSNGKWRCYQSGCNAWGDGPDLISYHLTGHRLADASPDARQQVREWYAAYGYLGHAPVYHQQIVPADMAPPPPLPEKELRAFLAHTIPVAECPYPPVRAFLAGRGYDYRRVPAAIAPDRLLFDWWAYRREWYPLLVTAWHPDGTIASVHGRSALESPPKGKKTRWPKGYDCAGIFFVDPWRGRKMLTRKPTGVQRVLVTEGLTDFLNACDIYRDDPTWAVLGGTSGSFSALGRIAFPDGATIYSAVDEDAQGEMYHTIIQSAVQHNPVMRVSSVERMQARRMAA